MAEVEDKRIRRTKKLLRQALTRLMQQKDFQSITVTDVVREAISTAAHFMRIIGMCMTCAIRSRQG